MRKSLLALSLLFPIVTVLPAAELTQDQKDLIVFERSINLQKGSLSNRDLHITSNNQKREYPTVYVDDEGFSYKAYYDPGDSEAAGFHPLGCFLIKYKPGKTVFGVRTGNHYPESLIVDKEKNIYVELRDYDNPKIELFKYSNDGQLLLTKTIEHNGKMFFDSNDNIVIIGTNNGVNIDTYNSSLELIEERHSDIAIEKISDYIYQDNKVILLGQNKLLEFNHNLELRWSNAIESKSLNYLLLNDKAELYAVGSTLTGGRVIDKVHVAKYLEDSGEIAWIKVFGPHTTHSLYSTPIALDDSEHLYIPIDTFFNKRSRQYLIQMDTTDGKVLVSDTTDKAEAINDIDTINRYSSSEHLVNEVPDTVEPVYNDFDNDGIQDRIVKNRYITIELLNADGSVKKSKQLSLESKYLLKIADFDGDSRDDLLIKKSRSLAYYFINDDLSLEKRSGRLPYRSKVSSAFIDQTDDGIVDTLIISRKGKKIVVSFNQDRKVSINK